MQGVQQGCTRNHKLHSQGNLPGSGSRSCLDGVAQKLGADAFASISSGSCMMNECGCRWLGHLLMVQITMHGLFQSVCWINMGTWREYWTDWVNVPILQKNDIFLAGAIAWVGALPLWLTSMEWCRRRFFAVSPVAAQCLWWSSQYIAGVPLRFSASWHFMPASQSCRNV